MNCRPVEIRRARPLLGTLVEVTVLAASESIGHAAAEEAFRAVARVHRLMSFHDRHSDVGRLNRRAWRGAVRVHPWTWALLQEVQRVSRSSRGLFDITVGAQLVRWHLLPRARGAPAPDGLAGAGDVLLLPGHRVRFRRRLMIDLGGIAKGFAVDRAIDALRRAGASAGVVNAGGDLRVWGPVSHEVHVRHPHSPGELVALAQLRNAAVATSAVYFSRARTNRGPVSALTYPGSSKPCLRAASASVAADRCVRADAWTKVLLLGGRAVLGRLHRAGVQGILLEPDPTDTTISCA
jgi:thiamine biosynthesis lipoprotein